jgi:hypothetical protein
MVECKSCREEIRDSFMQKDIFVTGFDDEKGLSPDDITFEAEPRTSYIICQKCFNRDEHIKT